MFPFLPVIFIVALIGSAAGIVWYYSLSSEEQDKANRLAEETAMSMFNTYVIHLTKKQAKEVWEIVRQKFMD